MLRAFAIVLLFAGPGSATVEPAPKSVKTETIHATAPGLMTLYAIDEDTGVVQIDWQLAEDIVVTKSDRNILPIAQLMLAIRDSKRKAVTLSADGGFGYCLSLNFSSFPRT